jgi:hypothetical protein
LANSKAVIYHSLKTKIKENDFYVA